LVTLCGDEQAQMQEGNDFQIEGTATLNPRSMGGKDRADPRSRQQISIVGA